MKSHPMGPQSGLSPTESCPKHTTIICLDKVCLGSEAKLFLTEAWSPVYVK